jgi:excisionase family DNA binding protein
VELRTAEELAQEGRVTKYTIQRWMREGRLPVVRIGRRPLVDEAAWRAFVKKSTAPERKGP